MVELLAASSGRADSENGAVFAWSFPPSLYQLTTPAKSGLPESLRISGGTTDLSVASSRYPSMTSGDLATTTTMRSGNSFSAARDI
jgi:hypothetical protein